jgi:hypothetical protein
MAYWTVVVPAERYAAERLFRHETLALTGLDGPVPGVGDGVALVAGGAEPVVFGLGRVLALAGDDNPDDPATVDAVVDVLAIAYTHRLFDTPLAADGLVGRGPGPYPLAADRFDALVTRAGADHVGNGATREWLVGLHLPIEAATPAEAVRAFWTYTLQLGPRELPAFVSPVGDELAMRAYVLGELANLDPEEDEE